MIHCPQKEADAVKLPNRFTINVLARDRVGIIADVSEALYGLGANLEALSQTVVWGWFTMIICAAFPEKVAAADIKKTVEEAGDFQATVLPFNGGALLPPSAGEPYVATVSGEDKPGIVRALTRCFATKGINLDDVWNEVRDGLFIVIFRITLPPHADAGDVRYELEQVAEALGMTLTMQHQDVFIATNSLSVHAPRACLQS